MQKDRKDILKEIREDVMTAISTKAMLDMDVVADAHINDVVDSIPAEELASAWIYIHAAPEANNRSMRSVGGKKFLYLGHADETALINMMANAIMFSENAKKAEESVAEWIRKRYPNGQRFLNVETGLIETPEQAFNRILHGAYDEVARRKAQ